MMLFNNDKISQTSSAYAYDNGQFGLVTLLGFVEQLKRSLEFWKLLLHHQPILALGYISALPLFVSQRRCF